MKLRQILPVVLCTVMLYTGVLCTVMLVIAAAFSFGPAKAQTRNVVQTPPVAAMAMSLEENAHDIETRLAFAGRVRDWCSGIAGSVPRNSPAEDQWLRDELSSGLDARLSRALNSEEYSRWSLVSVLGECGILASTVVEILYRQPGDREPGAEAQWWVRLAIVLNRTDLFPLGQRLGLDPVSSGLAWSGVVLDGVLWSAYGSARGAP